MGEHLYEASVEAATPDEESLERLRAQCAGHIGSWIDLLKGNLSPELLRILCDPESGLFPRPEEWRFSCSCPDWADLCKHAAAVLYAFGVMLDDQPELLFMLRGIDASILIPDAPEPASGEKTPWTGMQAPCPTCSGFGWIEPVSRLYGFRHPLEQPAGKRVAVFFDELAVERLFRVVERSSVAFLPVCPHEGDVRRECPQLFRYTNHGRNGSEVPRKRPGGCGTACLRCGKRTGRERRGRGKARRGP